MILSFIGDFFEGLLSLGLDIGDAGLSFLPFSFLSLCGGLLAFGGVGLMQSRYTQSGVLILIVSLLSGYVMALILQNAVIRPLYRIRHDPVKDENILSLEGKIVSEIVPNGFGSASFETKSGKLTYPVRSLDGERIRSNTPVKPVRFEGKILIVTPKTP